MSDATIVSIDRIQNQWLWQRYFQHKEMIREKNKGAVNEMELFHGTRNNDPKSIYSSEEGFDMRYSASSMWDQGNYFAVNADTVTGTTSGSTVYMMYDNLKAYPAYLITYQRHSYRRMGIF